MRVLQWRCLWWGKLIGELRVRLGGGVSDTRVMVMEERKGELLHVCEKVVVWEAFEEKVGGGIGF